MKYQESEEMFIYKKNRSFQQPSATIINGTNKPYKVKCSVKLLNRIEIH